MGNDSLTHLEHKSFKLSTVKRRTDIMRSQTYWVGGVPSYWVDLELVEAKHTG